MVINKNMKNLLFLILGIVAMIAISATTVSVMTVRPAQPKNIVAFRYPTSWDNGEIVEKIKRYSTQGYILKQMTSNQYTTIVVMERF